VKRKRKLLLGINLCAWWCTCRYVCMSQWSYL